MKTASTAPKKARFNARAYNAQVAGFEDIRRQLNDIVKEYNAMELPALDTPREFYRLFEDTEHKIFELSVAEIDPKAEETLLIESTVFDAFCNRLLAIHKGRIASTIKQPGISVLRNFLRSECNPTECWLAAKAIRVIFDYSAGEVVFKKDFHEALKMFFLS